MGWALSKRQELQSAILISLLFYYFLFSTSFSFRLCVFYCFMGKNQILYTVVSPIMKKSFSLGLWLFHFQTRKLFGSAENVLTSLTLCRVTVEQTQMTRECSGRSKVNRTRPILLQSMAGFDSIHRANKRERHGFLFFCLLSCYAMYKMYTFKKCFWKHFFRNNLLDMWKFPADLFSSDLSSVSLSFCPSWLMIIIFFLVKK